MKKVWACLLMAGLTMLCSVGTAETAKEITADCTLKGKGVKTIEYVRDGRYKTYWNSPGGSDARIDLYAPEGEAIGGVYVQFYDEGCAFALQVLDESGEWVTAATCETDYLTGYAKLPEGADAVRVTPLESGRRLYIAEIHAYGLGDTPEDVQQWEPSLEKADLLVLAAHPDDEILFMGGTIPYYAGERKLNVQVAYLVPSVPCRRLELLDGLWLCGVRNYPDLGSFPDRYTLSLRAMYSQKGWSEERVLRHVTELYRRYQPEVVVTHDVNGEYGHGAHRAAADAAQRCIALAADATYQPDGMDELDTWQVKKLYLHLYAENSLRMDWREALDAFDGRTAFDVAESAFACHISQQKTRYHVEDYGAYDNAKFGLAYSAMGEDEEKDDFFEHIALE